MDNMPCQQRQAEITAETKSYSSNAMSGIQ